MKIQINPKILINDFVNPALEVNNSGKAAILFEDQALHSSYLSDDGSGLGFYQRIVPKNVIDPIDRFNIDLNKLAQGIACITTNPDEIILEVDRKVLSYKSDTLSFKIRTIENEMVPIPKFNPRKMEEYPNIIDEFQITQKVLIDLKKADSFASQSSKFYLEKEGSQLFVLFDDKQQSHLNTVRVLLKEKFDRDIPEYIYNISFLRAMFRVKNTINIRILDNGALLFITETPQTKTIYCTTKLKQ